MITQTKHTYKGSIIYFQTIQKVFKRSSFVECHLCSKEHSLTIHHIVPRFIGKHFNKKLYLKCPTIVLCTDCHEKYELSANRVKIIQHKHLNYNPKTLKYNKIEKYNNIIQSAKFLLSHINNNNIKDKNKHKIISHENNILSNINRKDYTSKHLKNILNVKGKYHEFNNNYIDLGYELAQKYTLEEINNFWVNHWKNYELNYYKNEC